MNNQKIIRKFVALAKPIADNVGVGDTLRKTYSEVNMLGEKAKFIINGRPSTHTAILLAGSGRSGTTWLSNLISSQGQIQAIHEPLFPQTKELISYLPNQVIDQNHFFSTYLRTEGNYPEWGNLLQNILTGRFRTYRTDFIRSCFFPDRYLVKGVRFNLMLGYVYRNFNPKIIYILRHPCSVIASRLIEIRNSQEENHPWIVNVKDLLNQEKLVEDYLKPWVSLIEKENDQIGAHAVYWAVENMIALQELKSIPHYMQFYEKLVLEPIKEIGCLVEFIGLNLNINKLLPKISTGNTSSYHHNDISEYARLSRWRKKLTEEEQNRILWWANELVGSQYSKEILPRGYHYSF